MDKKVFFVFTVIIIMVMSACGTVSSVTGGTIAYPQPVLISETTTFRGSGIRYDSARESAIKEAKNSGYTKIVAETIELSQASGLCNVTLVMIK